MERGFTLIELLVVTVLFGLVVLLGLPALHNMIERSKTEGVVRETAALMRIARIEAIRRGVPTGVQIEFANSRVVGYVETADPYDGFTLGADEELKSIPLPRGVTFRGPTPGPGDASVGFAETGDEEGYAVFEANGSAVEEGSFRFGDARGNLLEVRVAPAATARTAVRKYEDGSWLEQGEGGRSWSWN